MPFKTKRKRKKYSIIKHKQKSSESSPRDVVVKELHSNILVSEFELQSCHYVPFLFSTPGRGRNTPYPHQL